MKKCPVCGFEKGKNEFYKNRSSKDGLQRKCKGCIKQYYKTNKERIIEYSERYRRNNEEKIANKNKVYYEKNRCRIRAQRKIKSR